MSSQISKKPVPSSRPGTPTDRKPIPGNAVTDTPAKSHSTSKHKFLHGFLNDKRGGNLEDLDYVAVEIDEQAFMKYLLPPLNDGINMDQIVDTLKKSGVIIESTSQPGGTSELCWKDFEAIPTSKGFHEDAIFAPLRAIFDEITACATAQLGGLQPTVLLRMHPKYAPKSHRQTTNQPDFYFILGAAELDAERQECELKEKLQSEEKERMKKEKGSKADSAGKSKKKAENIHVPREWYNISLTGEVKRGDATSKQDDDVAKVLYNVQVTMMVDPCRRFTFGITIEKTSMRLWFCCRSIVVVSEIIDFKKDVYTLIHVFLAFAFASKQELGWDPTIQPFRRADGERAYRIEVNGQIYETIKMLQDSGADSVISRGSREWIVLSIATQKYYVLKDIWVEDTRDLEHVIRERILCDVENKFGKDARKETESHLLTPVASWIVEIKGIQDHTTKLIMRGYEPSFEKGFFLKQHTPRVNTSGQPVSHPAASDFILKSSGKHRPSASPFIFARRKRLHHRQHYRVIFQEVGNCLYNVSSLSDVFLVLRDSAKALKWIHGSGWLHRDISIGNLYLYEGRGLIGDLEYCKRKDSDVAHEVRSCSIDFMSGEVIENDVSFPPWPGKSGVENLKALLDAEGEGAIDANPRPKSNVTFFYFDLHDLESLWWFAIWVLVFNRDSNDAATWGPEDDQQYLTWKEIALKLFPRTHDASERHRLLRGQQIDEDTFELMSASFRGVFGSILTTLGSSLVQKYKEFEARLPDKKWETFDGFQDLVARSFDLCLRNTKGISLSPRVPTSSLSKTRRQDASTQDQADERSPVNLDEDLKITGNLLSKLIIGDDADDGGEAEDITE
ncbi:hypothetical protein ACEPAI_2364 [Sanghuangporus weigelae]